MRSRQIRPSRQHIVNIEKLSPTRLRFTLGCGCKVERAPRPSSVPKGVICPTHDERVEV